MFLPYPELRLKTSANISFYFKQSHPDRQNNAKKELSGAKILFTTMSCYLCEHYMNDAGNSYGR
jgi:hypothetical protein